MPWTGHDKPLPLYRVALPDGTTRELAEVRRIGIQATLVDPKAPEQEYKVNIRERKPVREFQLATGNYTEVFGKFSFGTFLWNSVFITVVATLITLLFNAMAAFALSKYRFGGRDAVFLLIISTLMIPPTIILVPNFLVVSELGLLNSLWGVIWPAVATPTGVFLLRQYMLTIPDELIDAARMDHASEWRIFWRIILPLSAPALAVLAIFSVMWRWNDFLWPLIVLSRTEKFTLAARPQRLSGRADDRMALPARHDRDHAAAGYAGVRVPAAAHHHRHRVGWREVGLPNRSRFQGTFQRWLPSTCNASSSATATPWSSTASTSRSATASSSCSSVRPVAASRPCCA